MKTVLCGYRFSILYFPTHGICIQNNEINDILGLFESIYYFVKYACPISSVSPWHCKEPGPNIGGRYEIDPSSPGSLDLSFVQRPLLRGKSLVVSENTFAAYARDVYSLQFYLAQTGQVLTEFSLLSYFDSLHASLATQCRRKAGIKKAFIERACGDLHQLALIYRLFSKIRTGTPARAFPREKLLSKDEIQRLVSHSTPSTGLLIEFLYYSACRISEALAVRLTDLVPAPSASHIRIRIIGKGRKERFVFIGSPLLARIQSHFHGAVYLFESSYHRPFTRQNIARSISKSALAILGKRISPHTLRHCFATHAITSGVFSIKAVSLYLGHASTSTTADIYLHDQMDPATMDFTPMSAANAEFNPASFKQRSILRQVDYRLSSPGGESMPDGIYRHYLADPVQNLFSGIRQAAPAYFHANHIRWCGSRDGLSPSPDMISSQVACVNHLFPLRTSREQCLRLLQNINADFTDALAFTPDGAYIDFEYSGMINFLGERSHQRGKLCTCFDALAVGLRQDGRKTIIAIEWKFTETYHGVNLATAKWGPQRLATYTPFLTALDSPISLASAPAEAFFFEPAYQFLRQTLLANEIVKAGEFASSGFLYVQIVPDGNTELRTCQPSPGLPGASLEAAWRAILRHPAGYKVLSPDTLLAGAATGAHHDYLASRYGLMDSTPT